MATGSKSSLFTPVKVGIHQLHHKVALAPLTRMRGDQYQPSKTIIADYYAQRASKGGLIITEGTHISPQSGAQNQVPGIWNAEQARFWKTVTDGVRAKEAISACQLWHRGRCPGKREWEYEGRKYQPIGPSAIAEKEKAPVPKEMTVADIDGAVAEFANAAQVAVEKAGFDLVEIHDANGYLLDQFLQSMSNKRTDDYGGSIQKRFTMSLRVLEAVTKAIGQEKVGVRFSPYSEFQGMREEEPLKTFVPLIEQVLDRFPHLAYIHLVEARISGGGDSKNWSDKQSLDPFRRIIQKHNEKSGSHVALIVAGVPVEDAMDHAKRYPDELIAFGRYFISNPDLPERLQNGWPLIKYDRSTFYTPDEKGYTDYPSFQQARSNL